MSLALSAIAAMSTATATALAPLDMIIFRHNSVETFVVIMFSFDHFLWRRQCLSVYIS